MVKVELTSASNGVIKKITDDNFNGAGEAYALTKIYPIDDGGESAAIQTYELLNDLIEDLGVDTGAEVHEHTLELNLEWGDDYVPTLKEVKDRIAVTRAELTALRDLAKKLR